MNRAPVSDYEFGPFRLNVTERLLQRNGTIVPLTPKLIDTLVLLVENSGHVLTKESLMQALWPDTFVEESSLTQNVSLLRKALGDNGGQHYIETLPKRGYRFVADVRRLTPSEFVTHERTSIVIEEEQLDDSGNALARVQDVTVARFRRSPRTVLLAIFAGSIVLGTAIMFAWFQRNGSTGQAFTPRSLAVLPFKTIGASTDAELMGLGMADAVIIQITRLNQPTVLPTSSVFKFTNRDQSTISIGQDLGVDAVLDGTVQIDGDRARVTAQLIRVSDGKSVWTEKFDEPYRNIFALQDTVSARLATSVMSALGISSDTRTEKRATDNPEAYQDYLMGMYFWNRRTSENLTKAVQYLEQAIAKDPGFARAHALLADCYYLGSQNAYKHPAEDESLLKADAASRKALELDDTIAEAHTTRAGVAYRQKNYEEADREFRRALEVNPNYAVAHSRYGYFLLFTLKLDEALAQMRLAQELDPISPASNMALGYLLFMSRDFDGAINSYKIALELLPEAPGPRYNLGQAYAQKGMYPEALAEFEKLAKTEPVVAAKGKIMAYGLSRQTSEAKRMLRELMAESNHEQISMIELATIYASIGEKDLALQELELALKKYGRTDLFSYAAKMKFDPQVDPLRGEPRFNEWLRIITEPGPPTTAIKLDPSQR